MIDNKFKDMLESLLSVKCITISELETLIRCIKGNKNFEMEALTIISREYDNGNLSEDDIITFIDEVLCDDNEQKPQTITLPTPPQIQVKYGIRTLKN